MASYGAVPESVADGLAGGSGGTMASYGAVPETVVDGLAGGSDDQRAEMREFDAKFEPQGVLENLAPYVAEFVGTFLLVFSMGCCAICGDALWNPTGIGCVVVVAVYAFGPVSGAHLNPAVTLSRCISFKLPWSRMPGYIVAQCAGGLAGSGLYSAIFDFPQSAPMLSPLESFNLLDIAIVEFIYTGMFCFVVLNCMASNRNNRRDDENHFFALAIGFVYIAGGYPAQSVSGSGGLFNPAASLAIGVASQKYFHILAYVGAELAGAFAASFLFGMVRPEDFKAQYDGTLDEFEVPLRAKLISELLGTFLVVMTAGLNIVSFKSDAGPWSTAAAYVSMIYSLGDVSGGHFNPCVTLAVVLSRRGICSPDLGISYLINQAGGGALAGLLFAHFDIVKSAGNEHDVLAVLKPNKGFTWFELCMTEGLFTLLVCFAYLAVYTSTMPPSTTKTNFYFGLVVGTCVAITGFATGAISSGSVNPAFALGDMVAYVRYLLNSHASIDWVHVGTAVGFTMFEFGGGAAAALLFGITHQKEYMKDETGYPHVP